MAQAGNSGAVLAAAATATRRAADSIKPAAVQGNWHCSLVGVIRVTDRALLLLAR